CCSQAPLHPLALHSFPTRRSSDLIRNDKQGAHFDFDRQPWPCGTCNVPPRRLTAPSPDRNRGLTDSQHRGSAAIRSGSNGSASRSEEHTSELQSLRHLVCRLLLEK